MVENSVGLARSSGAGGRSSCATGAECDREHPRNILIAVPDLARDPGLLCGTLLLSADVTGQASRSVSRGTLDSSVPQVVKSTRFCSRIYYRFAGTFFVLHHHLPGQPIRTEIRSFDRTYPDRAPDPALQVTVISDVVIPSATELMEACNRCADLRQAMKERAQTPPRSPSNLRPKTLSERLRFMSPAEPVRSSAVARAPAWSSALALFSFSIGRTFRASLRR